MGRTTRHRFAPHHGFQPSSSSSSSFLAQPALPSPRSRTTHGRGRQALAPIQREAVPPQYAHGRHGLPSPKKKRQLAPLHPNSDPRTAGAPRQRAPDCDYSSAPATYRPPPPPKLDLADSRTRRRRWGLRAGAHRNRGVNREETRCRGARYARPDGRGRFTAPRRDRGGPEVGSEDAAAILRQTKAPRRARSICRAPRPRARRAPQSTRW